MKEDVAESRSLIPSAKPQESGDFTPIPEAFADLAPRDVDYLLRLESAWADLGLLPKQRAFLVAYAVLPVITRAAAKIGMAPQLHYYWMSRAGDDDDYGKVCAAYAKTFSEAKELGTQRLEAEAYRRGVEGVPRYKFYGGQVMKDDSGEPFVELEYSDRLLEMLLVSREPGRYGRRQMKLEHSGPGDGPIDLAFQEALEKVYGD